MPDLRLLPIETVRSLLRFRDPDPATDALLEISAYFGIDLDEARRRVSAARTIGFDDSQARDQQAVDEFYAQSESYFLDQLLGPARLPHLLGRTQVALSLALQVKARTFLDVGGGTGRDSIVLGRSGLTCTHADIPGHELRFAQWRFGQRALTVRTVDVRELPNERFDLISCYDVLEHVIDPVELLANLGVHLRPNGYLCLAIDIFNFVPPHLEKNSYYWQLYDPILRETGLILVSGQSPLQDAIVAGLRIYHRLPDSPSPSPSELLAELRPRLYRLALENLERQRGFLDAEVTYLRSQL